VQLCPAAQASPQAPQLALSEVVSTHVPPHAISGVVQTGAGPSKPAPSARAPSTDPSTTGGRLESTVELHAADNPADTSNKPTTERSIMESGPDVW
jgi:hypothetical protein